MLGPPPAPSEAPPPAPPGACGYPRANLWVDTAADAPALWADSMPSLSPLAPVQAPGSFASMPPAYPPGQSPLMPGQSMPHGMGLQYASQPGTQWVDAPGSPVGTQWVDAPPSPAPVQDVVFQWVDAPYSPSHLRHSQHSYMQPGQASPYMQGLDPSAYGLQAPVAHPPVAEPLRGVAGSPGAPGTPGSYPYQMPQAMDGGIQSHYMQADATRYASPQETNGIAAYGDPCLAGYGQLQMSPMSPMLPYGQRPAQSKQKPGKDARGQPPSPAYEAGRSFEQQRKDRGDRGKKEEDLRGARGQNRQNRPVEPAPTVPATRSDTAIQELSQVGQLPGVGRDGLRSYLVTILESLYTDRIRPMANYIKGRLKERSCPELVVKCFVEVYSEHLDLFSVTKPQGQTPDEATILCRTEPSWFKGWIDIDSSNDPYDEAMWQSLAEFLNGEHTFAGGRYGMARELMDRNLPCLSDKSLGEVCHIVQLAIQHRRLIVYHRKMLKPIQAVLSFSPAKEGTGGGAGAAADGEDIHDMDDLCQVLFQMLNRHPQGLRLCRLKQMIKHEFSRKLSEMSFQCTKLIELFGQTPLAETFVLDTESDGKSIYIRLGKRESFSDHMKQIYTRAMSVEQEAQ